LEVLTNKLFPPVLKLDALRVQDSKGKERTGNGKEKRGSCKLFVNLKPESSDSTLKITHTRTQKSIKARNNKWGIVIINSSKEMIIICVLD
jgi:hypothetical protein